MSFRKQKYFRHVIDEDVSTMVDMTIVYLLFPFYFHLFPQVPLGFNFPFYNKHTSVP